MSAATISGQGISGITGYSVTTTRTATFEERAELVLALLLGKLDRDYDVTFMLCSSKSWTGDPVVVQPDDDRVLVKIRDDVTFYDIVESLYQTLSNVRGRQLR